MSGLPFCRLNSSLTDQELDNLPGIVARAPRLRTDE
jgi:hypothetical protein